MSFNHSLHDPYAVFRSSTTPAGLYARQNWLGESSTPQWKEDFAAAVAELVPEQSEDGLWRKSAIETIHPHFRNFLCFPVDDIHHFVIDVSFCLKH